jgi:hypothetical protein
LYSQAASPNCDTTSVPVVPGTSRMTLPVIFSSGPTPFMGSVAPFARQPKVAAVPRLPLNVVPVAASMNLKSFGEKPNFGYDADARSGVVVIEMSSAIKWPLVGAVAYGSVHVTGWIALTTKLANCFLVVGSKVPAAWPRVLARFPRVDFA